MYTQLWLVPVLPLVGALILIALGRHIPRQFSAWIGVGSIAGSAFVVVSILVPFLMDEAGADVYTLHLGNWLTLSLDSSHAFTVPFALRLDALSMLMITIITLVGSLIALYSVSYMDHEQDLWRYFASMDLFVTAMLILVLADNLLLLFLGWEGVGLCSYLLIGFWYQDSANGKAAMKAFLTTRTGDVAFLIGILCIFTTLGTLDIQDLQMQAISLYPKDSPFLTMVTLCLLGGAVGKSAQLPLQTWLPDAMRGPTPVSALIHAATMVTAGVYLIARHHLLFTFAPTTQHVVLMIGLATLLIAGVAAVFQRDLKRVLAYSTISQIGYMFLALGVGAYTAALFHFMTHAFFKALLFLGAGAVGHALHQDFDMKHMGGLRRTLPHVYWPFLFGCLGLAGFPLISSGFYSKEFIMSQAFASTLGGGWVFVLACLGVLMTAFYTFRMLFFVFWGREKSPVVESPDWRIVCALWVLGFFALVAGFVQTPHELGGVSWFTHYLNHILPNAPIAPVAESTQFALLLVASGMGIVGLLWAYWWYARSDEQKNRELETSSSILRQFAEAGLGFDWVYDHILVIPYIQSARACAADFIAAVYGRLVKEVQMVFGFLSKLHNGQLPAYIAVFGLSAVLLVAIMVFK